MENWWMNKCNSTLPSASSSSSPELRNQMETAGYFSCQRGSQDLRPIMVSRFQDPLISSTHTSGSHRSEHVNLGNSFLSLLSGPPSLLQRGFQDFSNFQTVGYPGKILPEGNNSIPNSTQTAIPLSSTGLPSEKLSWKNLQSGADFCPNGSSKGVPSSICASNSVLHDLHSSDLAKVVICHMGPGNEKLDSSYALSREWHSAGPASRANIQNSERMPLEANSCVFNQASRVCHGASPADSWKACREDIHTSQKLPLEANSSVSYQASSLWHGTSPADIGKACRANTETSSKMPVEAYPFISNQASSYMNGCPRVFCSTTSGHLLLSNTGLLAIVCSCHSFRMSAFKFCEHSGLYGVNPGDAIHMDSGETISQWCKLYLLKFGIRIPGDKSEWDWPEELSATASSMKCSVPMPKISYCSSDVVFSPGSSVSSKQSFDGISLSKNLITSQSLVISAVSNKPEGITEDRNNPFLKALTGTSHSNLHMADSMTMEPAMSTSKLLGNGAEDGHQFFSAYTESMHNRISSVAHPSLQECRIYGKESDFCRIENTRDGAFRDSAISNIELRLGQPYQLAQTSGNPDLSAVGTPLLGTVVNPVKSLFPQLMNASRAICREELEFMQCDHFSANPSSSSRNKDWNRLNHGFNAFVMRNDIDDERVQKSCSNLAQSSGISVLANLKSPSKVSTLSKANNYMSNDSGNSMRNALHSEPLPDKYDLATVWRSVGNSERQLDMSHLGSYKLNDNDKGPSFAAGSSHLAKDLGFSIQKEMEVSTSFNRLSGNGESNFLTAHSCYSRQLSGVPLGTSDSRISSNCPEKFISFANSGQVDHVYLRPVASSVGSGMTIPTQAVSKGIPVSASTSIAELILPFCREEFVGVHTDLHDDKLQVQATTTRQMKEMLKLPSLSKNQGEGRFSCSTFMQHSLVDTSASGKQSHKLGLSSKHVSEAGINLHQVGVTCRIGADEGFTSMTGVNCCCHFSQYKQGNALHFKEVDLKHQTSVVPLCNEQPSPRIGESKNVIGPSEHQRCCHKVPCGEFHGSSSGAAYRNCFERNFESRVGSCLAVSKVQNGTVNSEASMILSPQFANSHIIPKDKTVSLDHKRKLSGEEPKNNAYHTSQWRDVPSKVKGVSDVMRVDRLANLFDATREDREKLGDTCVKCFNGAVQIADSMKEHEVSNISSGCSAPVVSQPSIEVSNVDSSTNDAGDHGCGSNFVVDEGSGIDKAWSSDDALESEKSAKFLASTGSSLRKVGPKNLNRQSSSCLLDDLKLLNSLRWQKGLDQIPAGSALHDKDRNLQNLEQGLKNGKRKRELGLKLNTSCPTSDSSRVRQENHKSNGTSQVTSQPSKSLKMLLTSRKSETHVTGNCITQSSCKPRPHISSSAKKFTHRSDLHKLHNDKESEVNSVFQTELNGGTNNHEIAEVSGGKTCKRDCTSNAFRQFQIQESSREDAKKTKYNSIDGFRSTSSQQVNFGHRKARPIVCGIYGELTDGSLIGRTSKPAKLVSLSRVLISSRKCILPKHCNSKSSSTRKRNLGGAVICNPYDLKTEKNKCRNAIVKINDTSMRKKKKECSTGEREFYKELFSLDKQGDVQREKDHRKLDGISHTQLQTLQFKPKEIRKRSIYELTEKGEDPGFKSSSVSKISNFQPAIKDGKLVNTGEYSGSCHHSAKNKLRCSSTRGHRCHCDHDSDPFCCVCGSSNQDEINNILECGQCSIKVHQACYGVSKVPKHCWSCRPCQASSKAIVCVLCGYGGGAMTQALRGWTIVESIVRAWNIETESEPKNELCSVKTLQKDSAGLHCSGYGHSGSSSVFVSQPQSGRPLASAHCNGGMSYKVDGVQSSPSVSKTKLHNSITMGLVDSATKQWVHMVCGLWTPETRCPNVDTMSAFDVSGVPLPTADAVCCMCKRAGGSCIQCRVADCSVRFHPWCAHQKGLLQTEVEGVDNENVGFYGRCGLHATNPIYKSDYPVDTEACCLEEKKLICARTEGYKGRKRDGFRHNYCDRKGSDGCLVPQEQLNAWAYINGQKSCTQELPKLAITEIEHDSRKEYTRYKQAKSWKHLVVYKSGIHALGLYTSRFISRDEMVVEYVGEIVGQRVADKRENEYQSGKKLQYKSACYFFRIDKEHIVDATCKGGIARFVNHSCSPNCIAKVISVRNEKKVVFLAERDIFPGEEITYDYHFNHEDEGKKIPCFCNSKNCRRYLN